MNKDESDLIINEIRQHLFRVRDEAKRNYELTKEENERREKGHMAQNNDVSTEEIRKESDDKKQAKVEKK